MIIASTPRQAQVQGTPGAPAKNSVAASQPLTPSPDFTMDDIGREWGLTMFSVPPGVGAITDLAAGLVYGHKENDWRPYVAGIIGAAASIGAVVSIATSPAGAAGFGLPIGMLISGACGMYLGNHHTKYVHQHPQPAQPPQPQPQP